MKSVVFIGKSPIDISARPPVGHGCISLQIVPWRRPLPNYSLCDGILRSAITNPCLSKIVITLKWNLSFSFGDFSSFSSEIQTKSVLFYAPERAGDNFHSFDLIQPPILPKGTANPLLMEQKTITTRFWTHRLYLDR